MSNGENTPSKNGNGVKAIWVRIIEMCIMSAIVGGITLWGNSKVMEVRMSTLCENISEMKQSIKTLFEIASVNRLDNVRQQEQINHVIDKLSDHMHERGTRKLQLLDDKIKGQPK